MIRRSQVLLNADSGALKRRLEQLAENARSIADDSQAGTIPDALPVDMPKLRFKLDQIENQNFDHQYQREIGLSKIPTYAGKQERDIASSKVWTGKESVYDASLRMLNDKYKPLPKASVRQRLHNARDGALDYQLGKLSDKTKAKNEDDQFAEMYRERLLGPAQFLGDSFASVDNSVRSLADQRIQEAQRRGEFRNIPRGKPLPRDYTSNSAFIDRTEYHLNNILKRQEAMPPWIEKQGSVETQIRQFRNQLDCDWTLQAVHIVCERHSKKSDTDKIQIMSQYAEAERDDSSRHRKLRSSQWEQKYSKYLDVKLKALNDSIRSYNLQAPLASQKLYLNASTELEKCYRRCAENLEAAIRRHLLGEPPAAQSSLRPRSDRVMQRDIRQVYQVPTESLGKQLLNIFRWRRKDE
ncbi:hypothetical protein KL933_004921 [Ogataea haglerorum]|uniref:DnaJ homologue subfamily C member 28 conserved domain-containing protein n=1 Tax=Ogataea haglerorum TaxID=1937702 RepID=A0AAN6D1H1_9ASCO|nr:hypothetical protein KL933_004921 [Ogataea haglerorum]